MKIVLASASPRRRDLLGIVFSDFEIIVPHTEELYRSGEAPLDFVRRVSVEKMEAVIHQLPGHEGPLLAIASDTIVTVDGLVLGKPSGYEDAFRTLSLLRGRTHSVITGLTLFHRQGIDDHGRIETGHETTSVTFRDIPDEEIKRYLSLTQYMDKAGSYAIQENGEIIIEKISGSLSNVVGFPMRLFFRMLTGMGITG